MAGPTFLVNSYYQCDDDVMRTYLGLPHNAETMKLYKNMRNGTFKDVTAEVGLDKVFMPMGANFGDIDNDGFLDVYLGNGNPSYGALIPHVLLRNHEGKYFVDVTAVFRDGRTAQRTRHCLRRPRQPWHGRFAGSDWRSFTRRFSRFSRFS